MSQLIRLTQPDTGGVGQSQAYFQTCIGGSPLGRVGNELYLGTDYYKKVWKNVYHAHTNQKKAGVVI